MKVYELDGTFTKEQPKGTKVVSSRMEGNTKVVIVRSSNTMINTLCALLLLASISIVIFYKANTLVIEFDEVLVEDKGLVQVSLVNKEESDVSVYLEVYDSNGNLICKSRTVKPGESIGYLPILKDMDKGESLIKIHYNITVGNKMRRKVSNSIIMIKDGGKI